MNDTATLSPETTPPADATGRDAVLRVVNGNKIYGGVHAIEAVNFDL
jgi:hypothetical protein